jgi:hypothetical protein
VQQLVCLSFSLFLPIIDVLCFNPADTPSSAVKLSSGSLFVFSPVALTPTVRAKIDSLGGNVSHIVAPDMEHHIFLSSWHRAYPDAHVIGPGGLPEKRAKMSTDDPDVTNVPFKTVFTPANKRDINISPDVDADMDYEFVDAHLNKELVFFHRPSKTLIQADLFFNLPATEQYSRTGEKANSGWASRLFCHLQNPHSVWQKRMLWYLISRSDRSGFNQSIKRIDGWGFENVIPCHGDPMVGDGKAVFERVMQWHLQAKK